MKIAIDLTSLAFNFSGVERYAFNTTLQLVMMKTDDEYELIFCNQVHPAFQNLINQGYPIHPHVLKSDNHKLSKLLLFQWKIPHKLRSIKADCFLFPAFAPPIFFHGKNMIDVVHDLGYFDCPEMWKWYVTAYGQIKIRASVRHCCAFFTVSNDGRQRLIERFRIDPERISVTYNAVDDRFKNGKLNSINRQAVIQKYGLPQESYWLCLATLEPRKNLRLLVQAYSELYQEGKIKTKLVLAGRKGWKIDNLLNAIGDAAKNITVTGFIDDEDLFAVYKMAKLFVFPSLYEGFGIPPLESLACGTPILVSDISVFQEIYGDNASYFHNNDIDDLKNMLLDSETYNKQINIEWFNRFDWQRTADIVYSVLCKAVKQYPHRG